MSSEDFTLLDMMNVLKWYELIPNEVKVLEQHVRTKIKFQGLVAVHEDLSESLIANCRQRGRQRQRGEPAGNGCTVINITQES